MKSRITYYLMLLCCLIIATVIVTGIEILGTVSLKFAYLMSGTGIHKQNIDTRSSEIIFKTEEMYMASFSISPLSSKIAVLVTERGTVPPGSHDYSILPRNYLSFIDTDGNELSRLDENVRKFSWSPDGEMIAYITGTYYEGGVGFKTTGVWIFNLNDMTKTQINKDFAHDSIKGYVGGGYEINWAKHDSNIYIRDFDYLDGIYRYNTKSGKSEKVEYYGIDFSSDGRYYVEGSQLYSTTTNENITEQLINRFGPEWDKVGLYWRFDTGHCLHVVRQTSQPVKVSKDRWENPAVYNVLYDVGTDRVVKEITLPVSRWTAGPDKLVFDKGKELVATTYREVYK